MTTMKWLRRASLPGLVALAATVSAGPASASSLSANDVEYASQAVLVSAGAITISPFALFYETTEIFGGTGAGSFNVVFTLPSGVTPTGTVTAEVGNVIGSACTPQATLAPASVVGGAITFTVAVVATAGANECFVELQGAAVGVGLSVVGANALATFDPNNPENETVLKYKAQLTGNGGAATFITDVTPLSAEFATSKSALRFITDAPETPNFTPLAIDVGLSGLGKKFLQNGVDTVTADIGAVRVNSLASDDDGCFLGAVGPLLCQSDGVTPFVLSAPFTINLPGNFANIASAFITPFVSAPPGSGSASPTKNNPCSGGPGLPGVVTPTLITFPGITIPTPDVLFWGEVCLVANGTGIIGSNPGGFKATATISAPVTTQKDTANDLLAYTINGAVQQLLYATTNPAYPFFVRIVNNTPAAANVIAQLQPEAGGAPSIAVLPPLAANSNTLTPFPAIVALGVPPLALGPGNFRTSATFFTVGAACNNNEAGQFSASGGGGVNCPVSISGLQGEPTGAVNMLGSGGSP